MNGEKVSVIMAVYNAEDTLRECLDSILAQTYTNWQFVICDDCSTDGTVEILSQYQSLYPEKFLLLRNEKNMHLPYSLNRCIEHSDGQYIARMDADDKSTPDRFEKQIRFLQEHSEYDLVGTAMRRFEDEQEADIVYKPEKVDRYYMRKDVPFNHATIMTYLRVYRDLNGYTVSERTVRGQDYDLWFRFFHAGFSGYNMQEPLYLVREDMNAIKRRTFRVRWNTFKTTRFGFKLLGFPKRWLIKPFFTVIFKSLVPYRLIYFYRGLQKRKTQS